MQRNRKMFYLSYQETEKNKYLVIINKGKTKLEGKADLLFHESIGNVMRKIEISGEEE